MASPPALHPALLPPGTVVGPWRVVAWAGRGVHGAVYRAVQVDKELGAPVALKVALLPRDPRMAREAELLSRLRHPSLPRLWDSGEWHHPSGTFYPYLAMEWMEGAPLYDWARQSPPSPQQVLRLSAQLASALQALHAYGAIHRDVKGDNILVRRADSRAVLTDLGSCTYPGAETLTPPTVLPGTPAYRSPEAGLFELQFGRDATARYVAGPADDLYALGVTACRLVMGEYPDFSDPWKDERGTWHLDKVVAPPALLSLEPPLRDWIVRLLSVRPEERGTAAQWAQELERAARHVLPKSPPPSLAGAPPEARSPGPSFASPEPESLSNPRDGVEAPSAQPREVAATPEARGTLPEASSAARTPVARIGSRVSARPWRSWLVAATAGVALATWAWWAVPGHWVHEPSAVEHEAVRADPPDAGTAGLGETAASAATVDSPEISFPDVLAEETPPEPLPGQARPDAKGRCPHKQQVALNGGCWARVPLEREECEATGGSIFKGMCYLPMTASMRSPTSSPMNKQDSQPQ